MAADTTPALVSIKQASALLGVTEATLRQWTDGGRVKAFITPGGHRRYALKDLRKLLSSRQKVQRVSDLAAELEQTGAVHAEIARAFGDSSEQLISLSSKSQKQFAALGRQFLELTIKYISQPSRRTEIMHQVQTVGQEFGAAMARLGLPLTDSVEAIIVHREPLIKAATDFVRNHGVVDGRVVDAIPLVVRIMDESLVAMMVGHLQARSSEPVRPGDTGTHPDNRPEE